MKNPNVDYKKLSSELPWETKYDELDEKDPRMLTPQQRHELDKWRHPKLSEPCQRCGETEFYATAMSSEYKCSGCFYIKPHK